MVKDERSYLISKALKEDERLTMKETEEKNRRLSTYQAIPVASNIDRGWAWVALFGACFCLVVSIGMSSGVGVLYADIQETLNVGIVEVSLIGSIVNGVLFISMVITSPLSNRISCRVLSMTGGIIVCCSYLLCYLHLSLIALYICIGIMSGFGFALVFSSALMTVNEYFDRRRSLATLILLTAAGVGIQIFGPLTSWLLDRFALPGTLLILGGISLNILIGSMLCFPLHRTADHDVTHNCFYVYLDKEVWFNHDIYLICAASFIYGFGGMIPLTLLPDFIISNGNNISMDSASLSITAIGATMTLIRIITGFISDRFPRTNIWMFILSAIGAGITLFFIQLCETLLHFLMAAAIFGAFFGMVSSLIFVLLVEIFGASKLPACLGIHSFTYGVGILVGSPVAGLIGELINFPGIEFLTSGVCFILTGILLLPTVINMRRHGNGTLEKELIIEEEYLLGHQPVRYGSEAINEAFTAA